MSSAGLAPLGLHLLPSLLSLFVGGQAWRADCIARPLGSTLNLALPHPTMWTHTGGVAALLAMLMRQAGLPRGLGPMHCIALGPAAVVSETLAASCEDYVTSVIAG